MMKSSGGGTECVGRRIVDGGTLAQLTCLMIGNRIVTEGTLA